MKLAGKHLFVLVTLVLGVACTLPTKAAADGECSGKVVVTIAPVPKDVSDVGIKVTWPVGNGTNGSIETKADTRYSDGSLSTKPIVVTWNGIKMMSSMCDDVDVEARATTKAVSFNKVTLENRGPTETIALVYAMQMPLIYLRGYGLTETLAITNLSDVAFNNKPRCNLLTDFNHPPDTSFVPSFFPGLPGMWVAGANCDPN